MREISSVNRLLLLVGALLVIILFGFLTLRKPDLAYSENINTSLSLIRSNPVFVNPSEVREYTASGGGQMILVDLRPSHIYTKGHIQSSLNVPIHNLLEENTLEMFRGLEKDGVRIVLYGEDNTEAVSPWTILRQIGFTQVFILPGGYQGFISEMPDIALVSEEGLFIEHSLYDYAAILQSLQEGSAVSPGIPTAKQEGEKIIPVKRKKQSNIEGGC